MSVVVKHDQSASNTAAFAIMAEAWNELVQDSLTPDNQGLPPYSAASQVLYAVSDESDIVGVLVFAVEAGALALQLIYVEPTSRRQGVAAAMLEKLKGLSHGLGTGRVRMTVPLGADLPMIAMHLGFKQAAVVGELQT